MPVFVKNMLESRWLWLIARCCLAFLFLSSGLAKVLDAENSFQEMRAAGLEPAWLFNYASAIVLLFGAYCILFQKYLWLGAGALSVFLLLTILIVHNFWTMSAPQATISMYFAFEHMAVIGGLISLYIAGHYRNKVNELTDAKHTC